MEFRKHRRREGRIGILVVLLVAAGGVIAVLPAILLLNHRADGESALAEKISELKAAGNLISLDEVNRRYHEHGRDPAGNAAGTYQEAFRRMVTEGVSLEELTEVLRERDFSRALPAESLEAIERMVAANGDALQLYRKAAAQPYFRADVDFTEGSDVLLPHVGQFRQGARLLAGEAIVDAEHGDGERAREAIQAMFQMAGHLSEEPSIISQLARNALEGMGLAALEQVLHRLELTPPALASLQAVFHSSGSGPRLELAFQTELAMTEWYFGEIERAGHFGDGEEPGLNDRITFFFYRASGSLAKDHRAYLTEMAEFLRTVELPHAERLRVEWPDVSFAGRPSAGLIMASILIPSLQRVMEGDTRLVTFLRAGEIALAAERYRIDYSEFPSHPEALMPVYIEELPSDPFGADGSFRFVSEDDAFFVRSSGFVPGQRGEEDRPVQFRLPAR